MKKIFAHLRNNWIKYGLETLAIVIGILGAYYLSNWHEKRTLKEKELIYINNLKNDIDRQLLIVESQREFEQNMVDNCEEILENIQLPPYDIAKLNETFAKMSRKSFVINNPVFEDLKFSGNLSIISNIELRNTLLQFYQYLDYVETVFANNNRTWVDGLGSDLMDLNLSDFGYKKDISTKTDFDFSLEVDPFIGADQIILSQLENDAIRFLIHNKISLRGRVSNVHLSLLVDLEERSLILIEQLMDQLK